MCEPLETPQRRPLKRRFELEAIGWQRQWLKGG
jgi:hypothetical protein